MKCAHGDCRDPVNYSYKDAGARGGPQVEIIRVRSRLCRKHEQQQQRQAAPAPPRLLFTPQELRALRGL